jgi:hypothetical protein
LRRSLLAIPLLLALTCILYIVPKVHVSELLQQSTSVDFQVEGFHVETLFRVNRTSRDAGSFPWTNAERGKPQLAKIVVVSATPSEAHTQIHTICMKTDTAPSLVRTVLRDVGFYPLLV